MEIKVQRLIIFTDTDKIFETWRPWLEQNFEVVFISTVESLSTLIETWSPQALIYSEKKMRSDLLKHTFDLAKNAKLFLGIMVVAQQYNLREELLAYQLAADHYVLASSPTQSILLRLQNMMNKSEYVNRRTQPEQPVLLPQKIDVFNYNDLIIYPDQNIVEHDGEVTRLTPTQTRLFIALLTHSGRVLTREWIQLNVFSGANISPRSIDAHIAKLKRVLPVLGTEIVNVYGEGYILKNHKKVA